MRRHHLLLVSLGMFTAGILCQVYNMFNPDEPYIQQFSFMLVAMPGVLAIINHYSTHEPSSSSYQPLATPAPTPPPAGNNTLGGEESPHNPRDTTTTRRSASREHVLNPTKQPTPRHHVADTSSSTSSSATTAPRILLADEGKASAFVGSRAAAADFLHDDTAGFDDYDPWPLSDERP